MFFSFMREIIVKSRMLFLTVNIIVHRFDLAGKHADWSLTYGFS